MEHSSDDAGITVEFYDETEHYLPGPRGGEIEQIFPRDSNREESSALFSEITRSAEQVGAQVGPLRERKKERGGRHFDAGLAWTIIQTTLATFASAGGTWLFFEQCQSLLARWTG